MSFEINGNQGSTKILLNNNFNHDSDRYHGIDISSVISIVSGKFTCGGTAIFTNLDILDFYAELVDCYNNLDGEAKLVAYQDCDFELLIVFNKFGGVTCKGHYHESWQSINELNYSYDSDQTFIAETIRQLKPIVEKIK